MSKGRLTRQELGWLLTQEARGAAERLRKGVSALTHAPPPPDADAGGVDATFSALDDAMRMLSSLHAQPVSVRGRRGRIDLASLVWEVAPEARVSIEPGSGTEVFGDESELRRMLHVVLGHGSGTGSDVAIRREADEVVLSVVLGPDSSATADAERAWLSRMAIRYGGRYELEGSTAVLALPAEGAESRNDVARLRKELDEARKQGEAYARELAAAWTAGEEGGSASTSPSEAPAPGDRFGAIARLSGGIAATLRAMLSPVGRDVSDLRSSMSPRKSSPDLEAIARTGVEERLEAIRRKLIVVQNFVAELAAVGELDSEEPSRSVDLLEIIRREVLALEARAARAGVDLRAPGPEADSAPLATARVAPGAASVLVRELLSHALAASRRGTSVVVTVHPPDGAGAVGACIRIDDSGVPLPAGARRPLRALEVEPGTFGRPSSVSLFVAAEIAAAQGAVFELGDAPTENGSGGGVRVTVTFPV